MKWHKQIYDVAFFNNSERGNTQIYTFSEVLPKTCIFGFIPKIVRSDSYTWVSDTRVWYYVTNTWVSDTRVWYYVTYTWVSDTRVWYYVTYTWVSDTRVWISGQCGWDLLVWHNFLFWRRFLVYLSNNIYRGQGDKVFWPPVWFSSDEKKLPYIFCLFPTY